MAVQAGTSSVAGNGVPRGRFGTFAGVFTPNVLTILGLILFLRTGWVVGQAGLIGALVIVLISNAITLLTGLSLSAIATSMRVGTGGNYYIISRSLGLEIGGAIGIPLFLSQAISVAFYIIGFTEALLAVPFFQSLDPRMISTVVVLVFGLISYMGADFALRIQYVVLAALVAALISFFLGGWDYFIAPTLVPMESSDVSFWAVFAVFFPAVTGITVGASMSGDLKNPGKSIPNGTLASIGVTAIIYIASVLWLATHASPDSLVADNLIMEDIARFPVLILAGVWAATLSSALGSVVAAPRVLQALAFDRVAPRWMGGQLGSPTEPRVAVLITTGIALAIVWMGDLNFVAPIISMFFLNTYGMTNLASSIETLVGNPSFRPRFHIHWSVALLGAVGCYGAMFLINPLATVIAIVVSYGIYIYLERRSLSRTWGDVRSGVWFAFARFSLLQLERSRQHAKNWRPNILVFTGQPHNREHLVDMANWLSQGRGIVTFFQLLVGDPSERNTPQLREAARKRIRSYIQKRNMTAFSEADIVADFHQGALTVVQSHGVGELEPNSVLMGWSGTPAGRGLQMRLMRNLVALGKSVFIFHYDAMRPGGDKTHPSIENARPNNGQYRVIDVWWRGHTINADLMLLTAHIIRRHASWSNARLRVLRVIDGEEGRAQTQAHIEKLLESVRVVAEPVIIVRRNATESVESILAEWSQETDLTILGLLVPEPGQEEAYAARIERMIEGLGTVLLVRSARAEQDLLLAE